MSEPTETAAVRAWPGTPGISTLYKEGEAPRNVHNIDVPGWLADGWTRGTPLKASDCEMRQREHARRAAPVEKTAKPEEFTGSGEPEDKRSPQEKRKATMEQKAKEKAEAEKNLTQDPSVTDPVR